MKTIDEFSPAHRAKTKAHNYYIFLGMTEFRLLRYHYAMFLGSPVDIYEGYVHVFFKSNKAKLVAKADILEMIAKSIIQKVDGFDSLKNVTVI